MKPEVKPVTSGTGSARPPRGHLTPIAIAAVIIFIVGLALVMMRPSVGMRENIADVTNNPTAQGSSGESR